MLCVIIGSPPPSIVWTSNGVNTASSTSYTFTAAATGTAAASRLMIIGVGYFSATKGVTVTIKHDL